MDKTSEDIMRDADALIEQVQSDLAASAQFYRSQGWDFDAMAAALNEQQRAQSQSLFQQDMEAVEQEVEQEKARRSFLSVRPADEGSRSPNDMV